MTAREALAAVADRGHQRHVAEIARMAPTLTDRQRQLLAAALNSTRLKQVA